LSQPLTERYRERLAGVLSCYDRIIVTCGRSHRRACPSQRGRAAQDPRTVESRGVATAGLFMLVLLAPGFSSSVVGVMAGQAIMQGFVSFRIPLWLRRLVVIMPSFAVISAGIEITHALVLSQVVLSLGLPT
jgi:Mn2+/Fe2+ NRAMP family transporter